MSNEICVLTDLLAKCLYVMSMAMNWYLPVLVREYERVLGIKRSDGMPASIFIEAEDRWVEAACVACVRLKDNVVQFENDRF